MGSAPGDERWELEGKGPSSHHGVPSPMRPRWRHDPQARDKAPGGVFSRSFLLFRRPFDGVGWPPIVKEKERELYRELRNYC